MGPFVVEASGRAHPFWDEDCHISKNLQSPLDRPNLFLQWIESLSTIFFYDHSWKEQVGELKPPRLIENPLTCLLERSARFLH